MRLPLILRVFGAAVAALTLLIGVGTLPGCAGAPDTSVREGVARDFTTMTTDGTEISRESFQGHVTIVDFWAVF